MQPLPVSPSGAVVAFADIDAVTGTTGLSTETVDGDRTYQQAYSDFIVDAVNNTARSTLG